MSVIDTSVKPPVDPPQVLEGITLSGGVNVSDQEIVEHVRHSITRGFPQVRPCPPQRDRVCIVGGGPSLQETLPELRELVFEGAKIVTTNGAYRWCLEHNLKPSAQVVLDARETNVRFVNPVVPGCRYYLASQCHPALWEAVDGRELVAVFHAGHSDEVVELLKGYYQGRFFAVNGGTTVGIRAINLLRMLGYLRFDLFGVDSCYLGESHHAFEQPENEHDRRYRLKTHPTGRPDLAREFDVAPWHIKQMEDFLQMIKVNGHLFQVNVHGNGLLAYALEAGAQLDMEQE